MILSKTPKSLQKCYLMGMSNPVRPISPPLELFLWASLAFLAIWPLGTNLKAIYYNCYNAIDFSIYQQAIYDIWTLQVPNPFVSIRNVKIFNDHFDPVIYLAVFFTAIFGQGFQQLLVFEWAFFATLLLSIAFLFRDNLKEAIPYLFCTILTKLFLVSFLYPIHPSTWACLPLFWLTYFIVKDKKLAVALAIPVLCLFKESYAFALFPLSFYYVWKRELKVAASIAVITLPFIAFELHFREVFLGPTVNYGGRIFGPLRQNPVSFLKDMALGFNPLPFLKMFYPFIACLAFSLKGLKERSLGRLFAVFSVFAPLLLLQIWRNDTHHHYGAQFGGILMGLLVSLKMLHHLSRKKLLFVMALFFLSSMGTYTKMFKGLFLDSFGQNKCSINANKVVQNRRVKEKMAFIPRSEAILATGGIVPFVMLGGKTIDHYRGYSMRRPTYDYLILERNHSGDTYPANLREVEGVLHRCRPLVDEVYIDNDELFFAKGNFENCVYPR